MFVNAWAEFLGRKERNGFDGVAKVAPEFIEIGRAGETPVMPMTATASRTASFASFELRGELCRE